MKLFIKCFSVAAMTIGLISSQAFGNQSHLPPCYKSEKKCEKDALRLDCTQSLIAIGSWETRYKKKSRSVFIANGQYMASIDGVVAAIGEWPWQTCKVVLGKKKNLLYSD